MFEKLNIQIIDIKEKLRTRQKLESKLKRNQEILQNQKCRLDNLKVELQKESLDIKKLEALSLTGLFYTILGSRKKQIEKEKQEFLATKLKYDECSNCILAMEKEISRIINLLEQYKNLNSDYERVLKTKEMIILSSENNNSQKLIEFTEKIADLQSNIKELQEAISVGSIVQNVLQKVITSLKSAENWGTWDMLGGGILATAAKHSRIDKAKRYVIEGQELLRKFQNELYDIDIKCNIDINISSFETFADYFFDGLISDWVVQSRIKNSLSSVEEISNQVDTIIRTLKSRNSEFKNELSIVKEERQLLIENIT